MRVGENTPYTPVDLLASLERTRDQLREVADFLTETAAGDGGRTAHVAGFMRGVLEAALVRLGAIAAHPFTQSVRDLRRDQQMLAYHLTDACRFLWCRTEVGTNTRVGDACDEVTSGRQEAAVRLLERLGESGRASVS
jgi:hypothetical protein